MFKFITHRPFWVNLLAALVLAALLIFGILQLLGAITKHGQFLKVPAVLSKKTPEAVRLLEEQGFDVVITDSVYVDSMPMGTVLKQIPDPNSTVKINRTVLLVVNRETLPLVDVPSLQGKSLNYAIELLKRSHLLLGDTTYKPDFMMGSVLNATYHGAPISAGGKLQWGSKIDLVIGGGLAEVRIPVPDLTGITFAEAKQLLDANGISIGALITNGVITDTLSAYVFRQNPGRFNNDEDKILMYIQSGQLIDLWISQEPVSIQKDSTKNK